ncbi:4-hydroxythreonine-4-phosphate dehydrogenase PdxA [Lichenihabitans sp. Uapishka_5]|uniref:4-hydroxythreonine-4-phosphate dehydrogenase PdxA n=1 Tax=Lichenihabitans sp. Uapishka_5 TaxID=3037302 RepID=UPI0029E826D2|nr:4-hydroxythreonine-4-phosphate dehydrogenase PdxA [Lichenihabitans sp. Uapishka_5]MDX7952635.1 4-hydroxythreonine-4-phosphate dehydrogenase PdxA [Lichenihabitans sp. Uapishka_5]
MKPPLGLTLGDAAGIGPEIVARLLAEGPGSPYVVYGDAGALRRGAAVAGVALEVVPIRDPADIATVPPGAVPLIQAGTLPADLTLGAVSDIAGAAAYAALVAAIDDARAGRIAGIVTAPISKDAFQAAGIRQPGHTEILAERTGTADFAMVLANEDLRVLLNSIHVALADAVRAVTPANELRAIRLADVAARAFGVARPRVAVAGLNPHAGENGLFGREEIVVIAPAIAQARALGIDATGPWPGDTVFMRARRGEFDIVVAQYHDQGLIPVKYLGVDHGVNITIGLPFPRTSPDHGTAFDIAGRGIASHLSLRAAFRQAIALSDGGPSLR